MRIIAEIGQNHQGKEELALIMLKNFLHCATSVKFQEVWKLPRQCLAMIIPIHSERRMVSIVLH